MHLHSLRFAFSICQWQTATYLFSKITYASNHQPRLVLFIVFVAPINQPLLRLKGSPCKGRTKEAALFHTFHSSRLESSKLRGTPLILAASQQWCAAEHAECCIFS